MTREEIIKKLSTEGRRANAKLQRIEGYYGSKQIYAGKRLYSRLASKNLSNFITPKGLISFSAKGKTDFEIKALLKALENFNASSTSTVSGIEETENKIIKGLERETEITTEKAQKVKEYFRSKDDDGKSKDIKYEEYLIAKEILTEKKGSYDDLVLEIKKYSNDNDENIRNRTKILMELF